ncbi:MAG: cell division protein FtsQ/DivIB [Hydrogenophaga sp.]|nr:cell division protein FtsQ/DivIB [Hydrogenophaga sp.]
MSDSLPTPIDIRLMNLTTAILVLVFCALSIIAAVAWCARNPVFDIRRITVLGDVQHNNAVTLRANVAPRLMGNFFTLDLAQARAAFEAVPWVRRAVVRREFPDRLRVVLEEHKPVAYWGPEGESRLVNHMGEVFEANTGEVEADDLPRLMGPEGQAAAVLRTFEVIKPLFAALDATPDELALSGRGGWRVLLDTGAMLELGRGTAEEVAGRTTRFLRTVTQVTSKYGRQIDSVESADLRHVDGYALRLRGVTTTGADGQKK